MLIKQGVDCVNQPKFLAQVYVYKPSMNQFL